MPRLKCWLMCRVGPVVRAAGHLRDHRLPAGAPVSDADLRPGAGEGDADHAGRVLDHVPVLPVGAGALLACQQSAADRAAVAREPGADARDRAGRGEATLAGEATASGPLRGRG